MLSELLKELGKRYLHAYGISGFMHLILNMIKEYDADTAVPPDEEPCLTVSEFSDKVVELMQITYID